MKLRNKKTGEIIELLAKPSFVKRTENYLDSEVNTFESLAELNEDWEDMSEEEPKKYWRITDLGELKSIRLDQHHQNISKCKDIGNYFETREEAEKGVEKLKAWKRLKDKGFRFSGHECIDDYKTIKDKQCKDEMLNCIIKCEIPPFADVRDVVLLFGGEE